MPAAFGDSGRPVDQLGSFCVSYVYGEATAIDNRFFVAPRACRVISVKLCTLVAGSDAGAVTATINKADSATAIASGTAMTSAIDLKTTANTNATLTLSATTANLSVAAGQSIGMDVTGVLTAARGVVTVELIWL